MSFASMTGEIKGCVPKLPPKFAATLVNRARADVYRKNLWSFLLFESNWTTPNMINAGTVAVTQGQNTITFDAAGSAALIAALFQPPSPLTQRQFRVGIGTVYNIWAVNVSTPSAVVLTLDRNYQEVSGTGLAYMIYQCYYPAPVKDWWCWLSIRDILNFNDLIYHETRAYGDFRDPQRTLFYIPTHVWPYTVDLNPASATNGYQLFELWSPPLYQLTYQLWGVRKGLPLVQPTDSLPMQVGEDCVLELAKNKAYEWAEANKRDARVIGSDFRFLMGKTQVEYDRLFREYRLQDRALVDNFATRIRRGWNWQFLAGWYSSLAGRASPGLPPW
jgi:hypothetical protein